VVGTTTNVSALSCAVSLLGQDARSYARKALVLSTPEIKMGLVNALPISQTGVGHLGVLVVPTGMPLIGPVMSDDMRPGAVSWETAGSDGFEPLAAGMSSLFDCCGMTVAAATVVAATTAYVAPPSGDMRCRPSEAAYSPVALDETKGSRTYQGDGSVWRAALANQLDRLPLARVY
jgi:hypothetical protein